MYLKGELVKIYDRNLQNVSLIGVFEKLNPDGTVTIRDKNGVMHVINDGRMRSIDFTNWYNSLNDKGFWGFGVK